MQVLLDGNVVNSVEWSIRTVGDLIRRLSDLPGFRNRVVQAISVDGLELYDWTENSSIELPQDATIHVRTQSVAELIISTLQSAMEYLPRLDSGGVRAATLIHEGREREAFELVAQLVEGLEWYAQLLGNLSQLLPQEEQRASELLTALGNVLEELARSWEAQDHTLLADLLEYELPPEIEKGLEYVEELIRTNSIELGNQA